MSESNQMITTQRTQPIAATFIHPDLHQADPEAIRKFLNFCDQYVHEVQARARQLGLDGNNIEISRLVGLRFCMDIDFFRPTIALGLIDGVDNYDSLGGSSLRIYLYSEASESRAGIMLFGKEAFLRRELKMSMRRADAKSRIKNLLVEYHSLLGRHGVPWIPK